MALTLEDLKMIQEGLRDSTKFSAAHALSSAHSSDWIASGLAKISAAYGAALVERNVGRPCRLTSALDYCQKPRLGTLPVLVSLMGRHSDAVSVAKSVVTRNSPTAILITGEREGPAAQVLSEGCPTPFFVSGRLPERDRRFVNCRSIFMLSALAYQLVRQAFGADVIDAIDECDLAQAFTRAEEGARAIAEGIASVEGWQHRQIIMLGMGFGSELMQPWQSVFAESGIATIACLDLKDYTHGDHLAAMRASDSIYLVIQHTGLEELARIFSAQVGSRCPVVGVPLVTSGPIRFWENLFYCCNTADNLTRHLGHGGQRPPKDSTVHGWREWGSIV